MESEIRIVKLERIASIENKDNHPKHVNEESVERFFATDYFDSLTVTKKNLHTPLAAIMNDENGKNNSDGKTSVQSYTLYYSKSMAEKYEKGLSDKYRRNPFEQKKDSLRYLSIIQVHITPEAIRRSTYKGDELWKEDSIILEPFLDDLYDAVYQYSRDYEENAFCYRIYQVLSAGDLAVVVKSRYPETSFHISSEIRKRVIRMKPESDFSEKKLVLYKTYTLFSIEYGAKLYSAEDRQHEDGKKKSKFVIRGCYSNKYWSGKGTPQIKKIENLQNKIECVFGLNGRYDFSIDLTLEEFARLYPIIQKYKGMSTDSEEETDTESEKVEFLKALLEDQYLSYINERYLLSDLETEKDPAEGYISQYIELDEKPHTYEELRAYNDKFIDRLMKKFEEVQSETIRLRDAHKNLEQYFKLMKRQILSCKTINQMSDTRIYMQKIGKQIEIALESIEIYRETSVEENNECVVQMMVENMRSAVHMIDCYMGYIRNNNLQSMQTPNYNIESSMSMEKILIGYNEYLREFIYAYMVAYDDIEKRIFLPVVIPDLHYMDISVQVLFPEGISMNWKEESKKRKQKKENHFLMIVESPTLAELGDIPILMALLFHEMAHQFRYKSRKDRNIILLELLVDKYASEIAGNMAQKICWDIFGAEVEGDLSKILQGGLKKEILLEIKEYFDKNDKKWEAPLIYFKDEVLGLLCDLSQSWNFQEDWEDIIKYFIKSIQKNENLCKEPQLEFLNKIKMLLDNEHRYNNMQSDLELQQTRDQLIKYAFLIAVYVACDGVDIHEIKGLECFSDKKYVESWVNYFDAEVFYKPKWSEMKKGLKEKGCYNEERIAEIETALNYIRNYFCSPTAGKRCRNNFKSTGKILRIVYENACREWKEKENHYAKIILPERWKENEERNKTIETYRSWALAGRYLGIDYSTEDNREKCIRILRDNSFAKVNREKLEQEVKMYREVTADMFMYIFMDMSPFTYLNLISSIIPKGNLQGLSIKRIVTVLYIMSVEQRTEPFYESRKQERGAMFKKEYIGYYDAMMRMWKEFEAYCEKNLESKKEEFMDIFQQLEKVMGEYEKRNKKDEKTVDYVDLAALIETVELSAKSLAEFSRGKKTDHLLVLIQIKKICELLQSIILSEEYYINLLEENEKIKADYIAGKDFWKRKYEKFKQGQVKLCEKDKRMIQEILKLAERSKNYLLEEHYKVGEVKNDELNEAGINLLLRCYYNQKIEDSKMEESNENSHRDCI